MTEEHIYHGENITHSQLHPVTHFSRFIEFLKFIIIDSVFAFFK